jgi:hypothetical protein
VIALVLIVLSIVAIIGALCIPSTDNMESRAMGAILSIVCVCLMTAIVVI